MQNFDSLNLSARTLDALAAMGYETPSPIQAQAIPVFLSGRDVLAQARTGTGKTAAFGIPVIEMATRTTSGPAAVGVVALVLVPTRELALQVADELVDLAKASPVRIIPIYGGVGMGRQTEELRRHGIQIVVATPGRLLDHLGQGTVRLGNVRQLILDEADRMLDMGFLPDVERILRALPPQRQTGMFSATVPEPIRRLSQKFLRDPTTVKVESGEVTTPLAEQFKVMVEKSQKTRALLALLEKEKPEQVMVFTRTKHLAKRLAPALERSGHKAVALQGNMSQAQRERAMDAFREGKADILVATDIASRGIDVPQTSHVVNYDLPDEPEAYVHRIGRTGRMGRTGRAFTFVQSDQVRDLRDIERLTGVPLNAFDVGELPPEPPKPVQHHGAQHVHGGRGRNAHHVHGHGHAHGEGRSSGAGHHAKKHPQQSQRQGVHSGGRREGGRAGGYGGGRGGGYNRGGSRSGGSRRW